MGPRLPSTNQELPAPRAPMPAALDIQAGSASITEASFTSGVRPSPMMQPGGDVLDSSGKVPTPGHAACLVETRLASGIQDGGHQQLTSRHAAVSDEALADPVLQKFGLQELLVHCSDRDSSELFPLEPERLFTFPHGDSRGGSQLALWDTAPALLHDNDPFFGREVFSFTAFQDHRSLGRSDYLEVTFLEQMQLYVLLESSSKVPKWLVEDFKCLPDNFVKVNVYAPAEEQRGPWLSTTSKSLAVWVRRHQCAPGFRYTFGAPQGKEGCGFTYLLAWRRLVEGEEVEKAPEIRHEPISRWIERRFKDGVRSRRPLAEETKPSPEEVLADIGGWLLNMVKKNRLNLQYMVEAYREFAESAKAPFCVTVDGKQQLLTSVAASKSTWRSFMRLVEVGVEIDAATFRFVLESSSTLPLSGYLSVQHFVLSYLVRHRNPIAAAMAFAQELDVAGAVLTNGEARKWRELAIKLRAVAVELLGCLEMPGAAPERQVEIIRPVLNPERITRSISETSPLQIAYDTVDLDFMSAPVVQGFMQSKWLAAAGTGQSSSSTQVPSEGVELWTLLLHILTARCQDRGLWQYASFLPILTAAGFMGTVSQPFTWLYWRIAFIVHHGSRSYFDSPQGRWVFKLFLEVFFLYVFHHVQLMTDESRLVWQHVVLVLYIAGMVVDEVQELMHQYHGCLKRYYSSGFNVLEALLVAILVACVGLKLAMWGLPGGQSDPRWEDVRMAKELLIGTASILVWARLLQYLIPLHDGVGSLLMVISQMIREVLKFSLPGVVLMIGVAFSFFSVFRSHGIPELTSFPMVLLQLFRTFVGETMFDLYTEESQPYSLYGSILTMLYTLMATVVMANLLIALMSYHYKPEQFDKQSRFQAAEQLQHYEYMVDCRLLGAPFSLPLLLLSRMPSSTLRKDDPSQGQGACQNGPPYTRTQYGPRPNGMQQRGRPSEQLGNRHHAPNTGTKYGPRPGGMPPRGGPLQHTDPGADKEYPTGFNALPYLVYLLTVYPVLMVLSWALYFAVAPYCIVYFTFWGYRKWIKDSAPAPAAKERYPCWRSRLHGLVSRLRQLLATPWYLATRPFWLVVGVVLYLGLYGTVLLVLRLGVCKWAAKVAFNIYAVLVGWAEPYIPRRFRLQRIPYLEEMRDEMAMESELDRAVWQEYMRKPAAREGPPQPTPSGDDSKPSLNPLHQLSPSLLRNDFPVVPRRWMMPSSTLASSTSAESSKPTAPDDGSKPSSDAPEPQQQPCSTTDPDHPKPFGAMRGIASRPLSSSLAHSTAFFGGRLPYRLNEPSPTLAAITSEPTAPDDGSKPSSDAPEPQQQPCSTTDPARPKPFRAISQVPAKPPLSLLFHNAAFLGNVSGPSSTFPGATSAETPKHAAPGDAPKPSSDAPEPQRKSGSTTEAAPKAGGDGKRSRMRPFRRLLLDSETWVPGRDVRLPYGCRFRRSDTAEERITLTDLKLALRNAGFTMSEVDLAVKGRLSRDKVTELEEQEKQVDWGMLANVEQIELETRSVVVEQLAQVQEELQKAMKEQLAQIGEELQKTMEEQHQVHVSKQQEEHRKAAENQHAQMRKLEAAVVDLRRLTVLRLRRSAGRARRGRQAGSVEGVDGS
ncbi:hypothetical protein Agub_g11731 [Astrephomene gubernaculifera]|uniref:Ion transport domain-containing protein n=1 Tax=Astrephomene gubernaculifera TaxID=47775 RepID=A0AAD3E028_9CHLO|nr:hypothetical protein Agub_g11731 [Astrephomene gubernaculifera]